MSYIIQVTPNIGLLPLPVTFTVTMTGGSYEPVTWRWLFRDSSESSTKNTSHTFTVAGTYDVVLITDEGLISQQILSSDPLYPGVTIVVPNMQVIASGLNTDFNVIPSHGYLPYTGLFDGSLTQGSVTGWEWNFGDGSSQVFGETAPIHNYGTVNTYNSTLTAYDVYGLSNTKIKSVEILPDLDITVSFDTVYAPVVATFTPVNDTYAAIWDWELIYTDSVLGELVELKSIQLLLEIKFL
jgi:PKD repeat protein